MNKYLAFLGVFLLSLTLSLSACGGSQGAETMAEGPPTPTVEASVPVEVAAAQTGDIDLVFNYTGSLQPKDQVNVVPGAAGRVEQLVVAAGDEVKKGDPLAIIDNDTYLAQVKQAEAGLTAAELELAKLQQGSRPEEIIAARAAVELARAQLNDVATIDDNERTIAAAALARAEAELQAAQAEYDKIAWAGNVGERPEAIRLQQATVTYENALADYELDTNPSDSQLAPLMLQLAQAELQLALRLEPYREVDVALARVGIERAEAALELAKLQLDETVVEAPFDGVIAETLVAEGSQVSMQTPVAEIISGELEAVINVQESRISQVEQGQSVSMQVTAYPGQDFPGVVTRVSPKADPQTRTFEIKVTPSKGADLLRSGMFADVAILAQENVNTVIVPRSAVIQEVDPPLVYVVTDEGRVEERKVNTGLFDSQRVEILAGLRAGEIVVTAGQSNLLDGAKVEVVNELDLAE